MPDGHGREDPNPATSGSRPTSLPTSKRLPLPRTDAATPPALALTPAERRLVDRACAPRCRPALAERAALQHGEGRRDAARFPRRRPAPAQRTVSKRRSRRRRFSSSIAIRRWSSASSRSTCSTTSSSSTVPPPAGARSRARAILACTAASRSSRRRARSRSATSRRTSISPAASKATRSSICACSATTTGGCRRRTCGKSSSCCSTGRTGGSRIRNRAWTGLRRRYRPSARRTATSRGSSTSGRDRWTTLPPEFARRG